MNTYIVLLRGVMPTDKNRVPMSALREVLSRAGYANVRTYIASGNVLVDTNESATETQTNVRSLIKKHIGPDLTVVVRTGIQLQLLLDGNPFKKGYDISRVFFTLFAETPSPINIKGLAECDFGEERIVVTGVAAYLYIPGSAARSTLSNNYLEKKLGVSMTTRNFNTLTKLIKLSVG